LLLTSLRCIIIVQELYYLEKTNEQFINKYGWTPLPECPFGVMRLRLAQILGNQQQNKVNQ